MSSMPSVDPPILISVGSFLIDAFDSPPRPNVESPSGSSPPRKGPPTPESPATSPVPGPKPSPAITLLNLPSTKLARRTPFHTPVTTPTGSGATTPQLDFDEPPPEHPFEYIGGGALYGLAGARIFVSAQRLRSLVDRAPGGNDLPTKLLRQVSSFGEEMWVWNESATTHMTRSRIRYDGDTRLYQPIVRPPYRKMSDLIGTPLQGARYLHISPPYSAQDVAALQEEISSLVTSAAPGAWHPLMVFEPTPPSCHVGQRSWLEKVAPGIHVLSPNHEELLSFYGHPKMSVSDPLLVSRLEQVMSHLLHDVGIGKDGQGILAVRCGRLGSCVGTKAGGLRWFPAYYAGRDECLVKDVTGAGNAFIGGYVAGLTLTNDDPYQAALYGTVAASFVVEQIGLPSMDTSGSRELCNGVDPFERVGALRNEWKSAGLL